MGNNKQDYLGRSAVKGKPQKGLKFNLSEQALDKIAAKAREEVAPDLNDLQNQVDSIQIHGMAVSNEFGDDPHIGISQKKLTESRDSLQNQIDGEKNKVSSLEDAVGTGGSVDSRIATAKSEIIGNATTDYNTLGKVESKLAPIEEIVDDCAYIGENDGSAVIADFDPQTDTVWKKAQTLSVTEKTQVQQNIGIREWLNNLTGEKFASYTATDQTTAVTQLLPATGATDTIYRVGMWDGSAYNQEYYSDYAWDGIVYVQLNKKSIVGEVFDISEYHAEQKYDDLEDALGTGGANVPVSVRKGGMSVKFVLNSDNKYVQYRYMGTEITGNPNPFLDTANWQGVTSEIKFGSKDVADSNGVSLAIMSIQNNISEVLNSEFSVDNKYIHTDGRLIDNVAYHCTDYIPVSLNTKLKISSYAGSEIVVMAAYDSDKQFLSILLASGSYNEEEIVINDSNISYIVACGKKLVEGNTINSYLFYNLNYATEEELEKVIQQEITKQLNTTLDLSFSVDNKYIGTDGRLINNVAYHCTDYQQVYENNKLYVTAYTGSPILVVAGYDSNKNFVQSLLGSGTYDNEQIIIPTGISYVVICGKKLVEGNVVDASAFLTQENYATKEELDELREDIPQENNIRFRKVSATRFYIDYIKGDKQLSYEFTKYSKTFDNVQYTDEHGDTQSKTVLASNMWNNSGLFLDNVRIAEGNTNFISSYNGYVGNGHGCEVLLYTSFNLDGNEIDFDTIPNGSIEGKTFQFITKSNMYIRDTVQSTSTELNGNIPLLDTNGEPVVMSQHNMVIRIDERGLSVDNTQRISRDNISFSECHGAMLEIDYGLFDRVWVNDDENTINEVGTSVFTPVNGSSISLRNNYVHGNKVIMYGGDFSITQEMEVKLPLNMNPGIYFNDYSNSRLKAYFQPVPTSTRSGGQTAMTFNTGDVIRVKNKRTIDF